MIQHCHNSCQQKKNATKYKLNHIKPCNIALAYFKAFEGGLSGRPQLNNVILPRGNAQ